MPRKKQKYKEIFKLKRMLEKENIPFDFIEGFGYDADIIKKYPALTEHYQICYPCFDCEKRWISIIEGFDTYGSEVDKLEIMGGFTPEELEYSDSVIGYLSAENVFNRIKNNYKEKELTNNENNK